MTEERLIWFAGVDWGSQNIKPACSMLQAWLSASGSSRTEARAWRSCVTGSWLWRVMPVLRALLH